MNVTASFFHELSGLEGLSADDLVPGYRDARRRVIAMERELDKKEDAKRERKLELLRISQKLNVDGFIEEANAVIDEGIDLSPGPVTASSGNAKKTTTQPSEVNPEEKIIPASDVPLSSIRTNDQSFRSRSWLPICGLAIGFLVCAAGTVCLVCRKSNPNAS